MDKTQWHTFEKLKALLRDDLSASDFVNLCAAYQLDFSNATISRWLKMNQFPNHKVDTLLRPLVLKIEDFIERMMPTKPSFENAARIKDIFDLIEGGIDLRVGEPLAVTDKTNSSTQR